MNSSHFKMKLCPTLFVTAVNNTSASETKLAEVLCTNYISCS